jgi:archaellum component FlaG (FlaF/FlaG flagellin family)
MIGALIVVSVLVASLFPGVFDAAGSVRSTTGSAEDRVATSATVINYELGPDTVRIDVLNNGKNSLPASTINLTVAYLGNVTAPVGLLMSGQDPDSPWWSYAISDVADENWDPGDTLVITVVSPRYDFAPGDYRFRLLLYNGASVEYRFNIPE